MTTHSEMLAHDPIYRMEHRSIGLSACLNQPMSIEECIDSYNATVYVDEGHEIAANVSYFILKMDVAVNNGFNALDACDSSSPDAYEYGAAIFDFDGRLDETVEVELPPSRILFLHVVKVRPRHRGRDLGLVIADRIISITGVDLAVCKPFPLQHKHSQSEPESDDSEMEYGSFQRTKMQALSALREHWRRLGFAPLPRARDHMVLSTACRRPRVALRTPSVNAKRASAVRSSPSA